jgi:hypothetical protein
MRYMDKYDVKYTLKHSWMAFFITKQEISRRYDRPDAKLWGEGHHANMYSVRYSPNKYAIVQKLTI